MTKLPLTLLTIAALSMGGCAAIPGAAAFWGNLVVLGITVGIFFGTLSLGKSQDARKSSASTSQAGK